jgi:DNA-binding Xre family transcriptional regulator
MLKYNIKNLLTERGVRFPQAYLIQIGFTSQTASRIVNNKFKYLTLQQIETICTKLKCTPNDLFQWIPDANTKTENHSLAVLQHTPLPDHLLNLIDDVPQDKMKLLREKFYQVKQDVLKQQ